MKNKKKAKPIHIMTAKNATEAQLIRTQLEEQGINCFLFGENFSAIEGGLSFAGIKIMVYDYQLIKALKILNLVPDVLHCKKCNSIKVKEIIFKNLKSRFLLLLGLVNRNTVKLNYQCLDCQEVFGV